jgi:hypothetical protein
LQDCMLLKPSTWLREPQSTLVSAGELEQLKARITALEALLGIPNEEQHRAYIAAILRGEHDEQYTRASSVQSLSRR